MMEKEEKEQFFEQFFEGEIPDEHFSLLLTRGLNQKKSVLQVYI